MISCAFLLQSALLLYSVVASAGQCTQSPVTIAALAEDFEELFPGLPNNVLLVDRGAVPVFLRSSRVSEQLPLRSDINILPLVWFSILPNVRYSFALYSHEPDKLEDPLVSVNLTGILPDRPFRYHTYLICKKSSSGSGIAVEVQINTTSSEGDPFCNVVFFFGKICGDDSLELGSGVDLDANDTFVNVTFFTDPTANATLPRPPSHVILPAVLVPALVLLLVVLAVVSVIWLVWYLKLRKKRKQLELVAVGEAFQMIHSSWSPQKVPHHKEFPAANLHMRRQLGEGAFGVVYEAEAEGIEGEGQIVVAVKQLRSGGEDGVIDEFFREVAFMSHMEHPHVVRLLGVCSLAEPYSMIFEFMDLGDLCSFLREAVVLGENETQTMLTTAEQLSICLQVARGAEYIASQRLVHRDLASRNCLVATGLVVKIADFGMSRNLYSVDYYRVQGSAMLPLRWMAPESVLYGKFSEATDVWSYGVLTWEVFMFGQQPFAGLPNDEVLTMVGQGRHPKPPECPAHQLMLDCWEWNPKLRPTFHELVRFLTTLLHNEDRFT